MVYGAFATLPVLLLWIYISWSIVLIGAELTKTLGQGSAQSLVAPKTEALVQHLEVLLAYHKGFDLGQKTEEVISQLRNRPAFKERSPESTLQSLIGAGFLVDTSAGQVVLGKSLKDLTLGDFLVSLGIDRPSSRELASLAGSTVHELALLVSRWQVALKDELTLLEMSLADLLVDESTHS